MKENPVELIAPLYIEVKQVPEQLVLWFKWESQISNISNILTVRIRKMFLTIFVIIVDNY